MRGIFFILSKIEVIKLSFTAKIKLNDINIKKYLENGKAILTIKYAVNGKDKEIIREINLGDI